MGHAVDLESRRVEQADHPAGIAELDGGAEVHQRVSGLVIGVPGLALEGQEDGHPLGTAREAQQQTTVLPDAVVIGELRPVALVEDQAVATSAGAS